MRHADGIQACSGGVAVAALLLVASHTPAYAQELNWLREDVRRSSPPTATPSDDEAGPVRQSKEYATESSESQWTFEDGDATLFLLGVGVAAATSPIWAPAFLLADDYSSQGYFPRHPYQEDLPGYMMIEPVVPIEYYAWAARVSGEYAGDFDSQTRIGGQILAETSFRLGIDTEFNYRQEQLSVGHDSLWTGDANLVFRMAQSQHWQVRTGLGFNWLNDAVGSDYGWNFTYGADWYPREPFIVSATLDWGQLGNSHLLHLRGTIGVELHGFEVYTGYDYYDLADNQINGFIGGVRIWF